MITIKVILIAYITSPANDPEAVQIFSQIQTAVPPASGV